MFKRTLLIVSAAAATLLAVPDSADARHRTHYYGGYGQPYYGSNYGYHPRAYSYGYGYPRGYGYRSDYGYPRAYGYRYGYPRAYGHHYGYRQPYYGRRQYYHHRRHRCGSGTTGLIVGGAAGALLGREIDRGGRRYRYYGRRGDGTTGAIIGGAVGALVGRGIARNC